MPQPLTEAELTRVARELLALLRELHARGLAHGGISTATLVTDGGVHLVGGTQEPGPPHDDLRALGRTLLHLRLGAPAQLPADLARLSPRLRAVVSGLLDGRLSSASGALRVLEARGTRAPAVIAVTVVITGLVAFGAMRLWPAAAPPAPAPRVEPPPPRPAALTHVTSFPWQLAKWDFDKLDGAWLRDTSGHGHDVQLPSTGYSLHSMFGRDWNGEQPAVFLDDGPDFAPGKPFHIDAMLMQSDPRPSRPAVLLRRTGSNGVNAWALELLPGEVLRFSIADENRKRVSVEGRLGREENRKNSFSVHANFDSETGELSLYAQCRLLGRTVTDVLPAATLPGARIEMLTRYQGFIKDLAFERGLMLPRGTLDEKSCRFVGSKSSDPHRSTERMSTWDGRSDTAFMGPGVARAKLGDTLEFEFQKWKTMFERTTSRGTMTLRRVAGDRPVTFEVTVRLSGEVKEDDGHTITRYGPVEASRLFAYEPEVPLDQVLASPDNFGEAKRGPGGMCVHAGLSLECEESVQGNWTRRVAPGASDLALSGGLLESIKGDPENDERGMRFKLITVSLGSKSSTLRAVTPITESKETPFVAGFGLVSEVESREANEAELIGDDVKAELERALERCSPIVIEHRRVSHEVVARFERGALRSLERTREEDDQPPPSTVECLRAAAQKVHGRDRVATVELWWAHQGGETEWEKSMKQANESVVTAWTMICMSELDLLEKDAPTRQVVAVAKNRKLRSLTIAGKPAPAKLVECVSGHLVTEGMPTDDETRVELELPVKLQGW